MRTHLAIAVALLSLLLATVAAAQQAPGPVDVVLAWLDAHERQDLAGGLALMADDAIYEGYACSPCVGKAAIGRALPAHTADTGARITLVPGSIQVRPTHVTLVIEVSTAAERAAGTGPQRYQRSFVVEAGRIAAACFGDTPCLIGPRATPPPATAPAAISTAPLPDPLPTVTAEREPAGESRGVADGRIALGMALALALTVLLLISGAAIDLLRRGRRRHPGTPS